MVGCLDPFKEVSGRGIKMLREAGVDVTTGVLERQCQWINRKFMTAHTHHRPYVTLKWAESADRFVDSDGSREKAVISSPTTMTLMHRERTGYDAIMVGANTVRRDNPSLLPRLWTGRKPLRVVMSHDSCSDLADRQIFSDGNRTLLYSSSGHTLPNAGEGVEEACLPESIADTLADLYRRGVTSLLVEGGPSLHRAFLDSGIWDEARVERSDAIFGHGVESAPMPQGRMKVQRIENRLIFNIIR